MLSWLKKLLHIKEKTIFNQPFILAKKPALHVAEGETVVTRMLCPECLTHWADATFTLGAPVTPDNFCLKEPYTETKIESDKALHCPACSYTYTPWAMQSLVLSALNRLNLIEKQAHIKTFGSD